MLATIARYFSDRPRARRVPPKFARSPRLEPLEGRALMTVLPVNFAGSVTAPPVAYKGKLYFAASDAAHGDELWQSDGTTAGTVLVKDLNPGIKNSAPRSLTVSGTKLYFSAVSPTAGNELWVSDGTAAGTKVVKDLNPGMLGSNPTSLTNVNGTLFFVAWNPGRATS